MRLFILGGEESYYCRELRRAALAREHECDLIPFQAIGQRIAVNSLHFSSELIPTAPGLETYDAGIIRTMPPGSLEQVVLRMDVLWALEQTGVRLINSPKALECAIDKYLTLLRCRQAGLPIPETYCCETAEAALAQFEAWGRSAVLKPVFGAEGRGVMHLTDIDTARRVFRALTQISAVLYLQRYIEAGARDLRVMMLGGEPLGAIERTGRLDFRANCAQSGIAGPHNLTPEETDLARRACAATGIEFGGVDLITDSQGKMFLLEVNGCPGWQAFRSVTGIDVAERLIKWLERSSTPRSGVVGRELEPPVLTTAVPVA